jgi:hypothetical protein
MTISADNVTVFGIGATDSCIACQIHNFDANIAACRVGGSFVHTNIIACNHAVLCTTARNLNTNGKLPDIESANGNPRTIHHKKAIIGASSAIEYNLGTIDVGIPNIGGLRRSINADVGTNNIG